MKSTDQKKEDFSKIEKLLTDDQENQRIYSDLWNSFETINNHELNVSDLDIEIALEKVHNKIKSNEDIQPNKPSYAIKLYYLAAAAAVLLLIGIGYINFSLTTISVPFGQTQLVELRDGTSIEMNSGSQISYNPLFGITHRNLRLNGEAFFNVEKSEIPFTIHANNAIISVLGTSFNVRSWKDEPEMGTVVSVTSGVVELASNKTLDSIRLVAGYMSVLNPITSSVTDPVVFNNDVQIAWRNNNLAFNNQSLNSIFKQLERRFDVEIIVADSSIENTTLTSIYSDSVDIETVLNDISMVKGLHYSKSNNGYRISKK